MPFYDYVRVQTPDGTKFSLITTAYEADPDPYVLLEDPATGSDGSPLPVEYPTCNDKPDPTDKSRRTKTQKETI
jgi:hypothetical protein